MSDSSSEYDLDGARREIERLRRLIEASKLINSSIEGTALYQSILDVASRELDVERGTLFYVDSRRGELWAEVAPGGQLREIRLEIGQGLAGSVAASGESVIIHDAYADERFDRTIDQLTGFQTTSILCAPIRNRLGQLVGVLQLLNKRSGAFGDSDLEFLEAISEHMAIAIQNAIMHRNLMAKNRMERDLQLGRDIQSRLFPDVPHGVADTHLAARTLPCFEVGGDYYDFIPLEDGTLGIAMGDVSGKGVSAALVMSSLQAALRVSAPTATDLPALGRRLNRLLYDMTHARKYVTLFFGRYQPATGRLTYINAGHLPPYLQDEDGLRPLEVTGRPIGLFPDLDIREESVIMPLDSNLYLYTDGFTDATNTEGEELGTERWLELLGQRRREPSPAQWAEDLVDHVSEFERGASPVDDKTLVIIARRAGGSGIG